MANMEEKTYTQQVEELLKLPQTLCKQCGQCCDAVIFKYGLTYDEIVDMINDPSSEPSQVKGAKDFLSVFDPISFEEAQKRNYKFTVDILKKLNKTKEQVTFFHCHNLNDDMTCKIHETRPDFCRHYPVCYKDMFYFEGCGYAEQARKNWEEIEKILEKLGGKI